MLRKYQNQLRSMGIPIDDIPEPDKPKGSHTDWKKERKSRMNDFRSGDERNKINKYFEIEKERSKSLIDWNKEHRVFTINFPYENSENPKLFHVRIIPGRKWNSPIIGAWCVPEMSAENVIDFAERFDMEMTQNAKDMSVTYGVEKPTKGEHSVYISEDFREVEFRFIPDYDIRQSLKSIPGWKFYGDDFITGKINPDKYWGVPLSYFTAKPVLDIIDKYKFEIHSTNRNIIEDFSNKVEENIAISSSIGGEPLDIEGLVRKPYPFQWTGIKQIIDNKKVLVCDDMGIGKTTTAIVSIHAMNAFPCVVICPSSIKINWSREWEACCPGYNVRILNGLSDPGDLSNEDVIIVNYDLLMKRRPSGSKGKGPIPSAVHDRLMDLNPESVVLDECHSIKGERSARTRMSLLLTERARVVLPLTGTPILNQPKELITLLKSINKLDAFGGWMSFAKRYCNLMPGRYGLVWGASNLEELNQRLRSEGCYIRRSKKDIFLDLPPKIRSIVPVELSNTNEYNRVENEFVRWVYGRAMNDEKFFASLEGLSEDEKKQEMKNHALDKANKASRAEQLAKLNYLRLVSGQGKIAAATEMALDTIEQGNKIIVFADHIDVQKTLLKNLREAKSGKTVILGESGTAAIFSEMNDKERQRNVDKFQNDKNCRVIVCSIGAGGVGWTGTEASHMLFVEFAWTPALLAQCEDRAWGRVNDLHGLNVYYLAGTNTIDESMISLLDEKMKICEAVTDGKIMSENLAGSIDKETIKSIIERRKKNNQI